MTETSPIYNTIAAMDAEDDAAAHNTTAATDSATTAYGAHAARSATVADNNDEDDHPLTSSHLAGYVSTQDSDPAAARPRTSAYNNPRDQVVSRQRQETSTPGGLFDSREVEERADGSRRVHHEFEDPATGLTYVRDLEG
ncbi:uncharacterized protein BP01DRAFT_357048 [Aspergillus saccharolyticus JOP 1030-1]|uniref:Uncharacterized protein n=1 Tax=Aspergillus saccharolyticus JOP 1030-1 TaxID=1450539 RepID=A0A318ZYE3_9EURO|nr:hypothetical protein BP01DRAFT_357048 [Aspergillus saccharolyticus JOP 1030-1]PYH45118.1 hypothetical protein BP01DRAFT_357048 [Aspergillus saccharolyticus JOP 1030-1]